MGLYQEMDGERKLEVSGLAQAAQLELENFRERFNPVFRSFLDSEITKVADIHPEAVVLLRDSAEFVLGGGKRLRAAFMYHGHKLFEGQPNDDILRAAISVELFHTGALVLDDIIDSSNLRRGKLTFHGLIADKTGNKKHGESVAMVAANALITLGSKVLSSFEGQESNILLVRKLYDEMCYEINIGQFLDMEGGRNESVDVEWIMRTMEYKTARYTVEKPLLMGAALAGAPSEVFPSLSKYAIPLGIAFQIQDDILGMFGDEKKVGKPVDSDLKEGKQTLLILKTQEELKASGKLGDLDIFNNIKGEQDLSGSQYQWVRSVMVETGALEYCQQTAQQLVSQAKTALSTLDKGVNGESLNYLLGIADYMVTRNE